MKYLLSIMIVLLIAPMSCYLNNKDDSRVTLNLTTVPPSVMAVHVAVYDGAVADENLLLAQTFSPTKDVELNVPAGENRIFVVWGENYSGLANYCGSSAPVDVEQGTSSVSVKMDLFTQALLGLTWDGYNNFNWNKIPGATEYELQSNEAMTYQLVTIYFGPKTSHYVSTWYGGGRVRAHQSSFNLNSAWYLY